MENPFVIIPCNMGVRSGIGAWLSKSFRGCENYASKDTELKQVLGRISVSGAKADKVNRIEYS